MPLLTAACSYVLLFYTELHFIIAKTLVCGKFFGEDMRKCKKLKQTKTPKLYLSNFFFLFLCKRFDLRVDLNQIANECENKTFISCTNLRLAKKKMFLTWLESLGSNTRPTTFCFNVSPSDYMSFKSLIGFSISVKSTRNIALELYFNFSGVLTLPPQELINMQLLLAKSTHCGVNK